MTTNCFQGWLEAHGLGLEDWQAEVIKRELDQLYASITQYNQSIRIGHELQ